MPDASITVNYNVSTVLLNNLHLSYSTVNKSVFLGLFLKRNTKKWFCFPELLLDQFNVDPDYCLEVLRTHITEKSLSYPLLVGKRCPLS